MRRHGQDQHGGQQQSGLCDQFLHVRTPAEQRGIRTTRHQTQQHTRDRRRHFHHDLLVRPEQLRFQLTAS